MKHRFTYVRNFALPLLFITTVFVTSCGKKNNTPDNKPSGGGTTKIDSAAVSAGAAEGITATGANPDDVLDVTAFPTAITITMGATATITPATTKGVTITQSNGDVIITATATGLAYTVTGTTTNGSVKIYSDKKFMLTLNGANITNLDGPAINIQSSKRAFIVLADGTANTLTDGTIYATSTEDQKGTFFSEGQLIFTGKGSLTLTGNNKHALCSDDYIRVTSGVLTVTGSISDGIHTNSAFIADGGTIKITAGSDGIETEKGNLIINDGNINITSVGKGIRTSYAGSDITITPYIAINGGTVNVKSTTGEGISSATSLTVSKGNVSSIASDDAFNAQTAIYINGGYIYASSSTNDAMDSNGTFSMNGGTVVAVGSAAPESSIDCDDRQFKITGGQLIGVAGTTSGPTASASTVNAVVMGAGTAQIIHIEAADGTEALTFQAPLSYGTLVFASDKLKANTSYSVYTGGSVAAGTAFRGLYTSGTYTRGTKAATTFTTSGRVTNVGGTISTH